MIKFSEEESEFLYSADYLYLFHPVRFQIQTRRHWHGLMSWTDIVIIYNKSHSLFMAESRLSRFQTAGKANLPDAAFFFLIKHSTLLLYVPTRKEGKHLGFQRWIALWRWPDDACSLCAVP
jgi:hypothetical protein